MVIQPCCPEWDKAHEDGTDNEEYGELVWYDEDIWAHIGTGLQPVRFCPWCAAPKNSEFA